MEKLDQSYIEKTLSYDGYRQLIHHRLEQNKSTGSDTSEMIVHYTQMNEKRMNRLDKTIKIEPELEEVMGEIAHGYYWVVLTEGWCGDAAQLVPVIEKIAALTDQVDTGYLLRDENPELMEQYLTRGGKAIPKLICYDSETLEPVFDWGPRPQPAQELFWKLHEEGQPHEAIVEKVQRWYNEDKTHTQQAEVTGLIKDRLLL